MDQVLTGRVHTYGFNALYGNTSQGPVPEQTTLICVETGQLEVALSDGQTATVAAGEFIQLPAGSWVELKAVGDFARYLEVDIVSLDQPHERGADRQHQ